MAKLIAEVFIDADGDGKEWPTPIPFHRPYTKEFVRNYKAACERKGQKARIVWKDKKA